MSDVTTTSSPGAAVSPPPARGPEGVPGDGDRAPARPSKVRRPRHSKPRFSSVTLFTTYLVLLLLIPSNLVFAPMGGVGTPANIIALGILLWYVISWIVGRIKPSGAGRPVRVSMFIFALAVLASFVAGMTRSITELESLSADRGLILIVVFAALVVVASQTIVSYERLDTLLRRAVVLGSVVAAIGIAEFYTGINFTNYIHIPGLSPAVDVNSLLARNGFNRPSSTATQPIEFGVVMAMLLPFALQQAFDPARIGRFRKWAPVALLFFAIPMSLSRSGIVGLAIALLWIIPTWPTQRRKPAYVVLLIGIASLKVVAPGLIGTFAEYFGGLSGSSNSDVSISTRTADYAAAFRYIGGAAAVRPGIRHLPPRALPLHRQHLPARPGRIRDCRRPGVADCLLLGRALRGGRPPDDPQSAAARTGTGPDRLDHGGRGEQRHLRRAHVPHVQRAAVPHHRMRRGLSGPDEGPGRADGRGPGPGPGQRPGPGRRPGPGPDPAGVQPGHRMGAALWHRPHLRRLTAAAPGRNPGERSGRR